MKRVIQLFYFDSQFDYFLYVIVLKIQSREVDNEK